MTRIDTPMTREPVEIDGRAMSPKRRAKILARDGNRCRYPDCEVSTGLEVDHIVPLALGGKDADGNLETLCAAHHLAKTRLDVKLIAKAKRIKAKHEGTAPPPTQKLNGRPFKKRWEGFA